MVADDAMFGERWWHRLRFRGQNMIAQIGSLRPLRSVKGEAPRKIPEKVRFGHTS